MKTLRITVLDVGTTWLETDDAFRTIYAAEPEPLAIVEKLTPGSHLYFSIAGEKETAPRRQLKVTRIAWPSSPILPADVIAPLLALAIFLAGVFMVSR